MKFALYRLRVLVLANMLIAVSGSLAATEQPASTNSAGQDSAWNARGCFADQRGQWFRDAKFGAFIHFGAYSELGGYWQGKGPYDPAEQIIGLGDRHAVIPPDQYRKEVAGRFNPTNFNAKQWISLIKKAGQKYVIVTTKHHDGFCMFHTHTTTYNAVDSTPFARDVIRELSDECKRQGIAFCPYFSIGDWCASEVQKPEYPSYRDYMDAQLKELLSNYGEIKMLWFDNYWYVNNQWKNDLPHAKELYGFVHSLQPDMLVNDRCGRGASSTDGDYATPENQLKGSRQSRYFEVVMTDTRDDNWGWVRGATNYRQPAELIRNLIDCTSKGGNFVLNVGPMASGEFPPEHVALLEEIGKWTSINGEAIYGTVPAPECTLPTGSDCKCYATKNNDAIYVHVVQWPASSGDVSIQIDRTNLVDARFLDGSLAGLQYSRAIENGATIVTIKKPVKIDPYATVVKLTFKAAGAK
jgi:alpha-L-fucosidase